MTLQKHISVAALRLSLRFKTGRAPAPSELQSIGEDLLDQQCNEVFHLFRHVNFCFPKGYNLKHINITERDANDTAVSGDFIWAVSLQLLAANFKKDAEVVIPFDGGSIYAPPLFKDNLGRVYAMNEHAIKRFMFAGADLSQHDEPERPVR